MLFTSGLRKAVDKMDPNATAVANTAEETARLLAEKRKKLMRRHTCSSLRSDASESPVASLRPAPIVEEEESLSTSDSVAPIPSLTRHMHHSHHQKLARVMYRNITLSASCGAALRDS